VRSLYLGLLACQSETADEYLLTPVSQGRLNLVERGTVDLRAAFAAPEVPEYFSVAITDYVADDTTLSLTRVGALQESWLPDDGLLVSDFIDEPSLITDEVTARSKAILHLTLTPPESTVSPQIAATKLAAALASFQNFVKSAYRRILRDVGSDTRSLLADEANWLMDVFGFSAGSFTVHLQSRADPDILGFVGLSRALEKVDALTESAHDPDAALQVIRDHRGHFVDAYRRMLKMMVDSDTGLSYQWHAPDTTTTRSRSISRSSAEQLYALLVEQHDLTVEELLVRGVFVHVNVESGLWTLRDDEGIPHRGRLAAGSSVTLSGVVVDTQRYELDCVERVEETGAGELRTTLELRAVTEMPSGSSSAP